MNYSKITPVDIANGEGVRVSLFVSGCRNHCKGCFNPETWDFNYGQPFDSTTIKTIIDLASPHYISGLTILGGDPLEPENVPAVTILCSTFKYIYPDKTIWLYTGYTYEHIQNLDLLTYVDVLVDGRFEEDKKVLDEFRGSSNQRIIRYGEPI